MSDLSNPTNPDVLDALTRTCCICHVEPDDYCDNPCGGGPLPGRLVHVERATNRKAARR